MLKKHFIWYNNGMRKGFTLIEALIVIAMIGILVAILIPQYKYSVIRAKEAVLKENLFQIRDAINKFYFDKKKYPTALEDLISNRYLKSVPENPFTRKRDWEVVFNEPMPDEEFDPEISEGIVDVRSLHSGRALDGSNYREW